MSCVFILILILTVIVRAGKWGSQQHPCQANRLVTTPVTAPAAATAPAACNTGYRTAPAPPQPAATAGTLSRES